MSRLTYLITRSNNQDSDRPVYLPLSETWGRVRQVAAGPAAAGSLKSEVPLSRVIFALYLSPLAMWAKGTMYQVDNPWCCRFW